MRELPEIGALDCTFAFMRDPYRFISKEARRANTEVFLTRLMLRKTICMTGADAARLFNDSAYMTREGAVPLRIQKSLFGRNGVHTLDDPIHRYRKEMFLSLMTSERIAELVRLTSQQFASFALKWSGMKEVALYPEFEELLTRAVCAWAGVPLEESNVSRHTRELSALFDYSGSVGPKHWNARLARRHAERWISDLIEAIRLGRHRPQENTAAYVIAFHREYNFLLPQRLAAIELLNVLRPTVAVAVYMVFIAHALHRYPKCAAALQSGDPNYLHSFVHEVRRFYPFIPATPAKTRGAFDWHGFAFPANTRVMLDLHGINHDPRVWEAPDEFRPERFASWGGDAFSFIPQGSGDHRMHHRCPGEWITIELMSATTDFLARRLTYSVPHQDLSIDESRLPALPRSKFIVEQVRLVDPTLAASF